MKEVLYPKLNRHYGDLRVALPPIEFWVDKIKNKKHFHFVKVNHGFFDHLTRAAQIKLGANVRGRDIKWSPDLFFQGGREAANYMHKVPHMYHSQVHPTLYAKAVQALYGDVRNRKKNVYVGISDSNGIAWAKQRGKIGFKKTYSALMSVVNKEPQRPYLHGGLFRHYTVANELSDFVKELKKPKNNVIMVGPNYCKRYQKHIGKFQHVEIPYTNALNELEKIVFECNKKIKPSKHNIILGSCALISFILARRFRSKGEIHHTFIDVGRSFDYLIRNLVNQPWLNEVSPSIWEDEVKQLRKSDVKIKIEKL